jgi:hypothetical protein
MCWRDAIGNQFNHQYLIRRVFSKYITIVLEKDLMIVPSYEYTDIHRPNSTNTNYLHATRIKSTLRPASPVKLRGPSNV